MLRPIAELLDFLENKMSMQAVYQPVIILHLLTRGGVSSRKDLARTLSGYDDMGLDYWDRVLMDSPKRALVGRHKILTYEAEIARFSLNFSLTEFNQVDYAQKFCETSILGWISKASTDGRLEESDILRHYRILEIARNNSSKELEENSFEIDEYAMEIATKYLSQQYPGQKIIQQPYGNPGFDMVIGDLSESCLYAKLKSTQSSIPKFYLSESDRRFSIDKQNQYLLILIYGINFFNKTYHLKTHQGEIQPSKFIMLPDHWSVRFLESQDFTKITSRDD